MPDLYLIPTRAKSACICAGCCGTITKGTPHYRHDPIAAAWIHRGQRSSHWCESCILSADPPSLSFGRIRIPLSKVLGGSSIVRPVRIKMVGLAPLLAKQLASDPYLIHRISPGQFEEFICDRLHAMGLGVQRVGMTNQKDGGVDLIFWSNSGFPILGAAQLKHFCDPTKKQGPAAVRDFAGVLAGHPFNAGLFVTNVGFSPDAEWFAREHSRLMRLRGFRDIRRWMHNIFDSSQERREFPETIKLAPGIVVPIPR